jgi:hypothetical protein
MHAVIRRYEGIDSTRLEEVIGAIKDDFIHRIGQIEGMNAYHVIDAGPGVLATIGIFETAQGAEESTQLAAAYIRDEGFADAFPTPPQVTEGEIVAQHTGVTTR